MSRKVPPSKDVKLLNAMIGAYKRDIDSEPLFELVSVSDACLIIGLQSQQGVAPLLEEFPEL